MSYTGARDLIAAAVAGAMPAIVLLCARPDLGRDGEAARGQLNSDDRNRDPDNQSIDTVAGRITKINAHKS